MSYTIFEEGHISSPLGYRATGISAGLKDGAKLRDLALIYSQEPCTTAALFTTSLLKAAPVFFNQAILARSQDSTRAVLINSGQANAGTGQAGLMDAIECAKIAAEELEVPRDSILLLSSGIIGVPLPMERMRDGIRRAVSELDSGGGHRAAAAILTNDTRVKERVYQFNLREGRQITLAGMAKGSRMVHPKLATLLCVITTDLAMDARLLNQSLHQSSARSFTRLSLDLDTSPNDTVLLLANGAADALPITEATSWEFGAWQEALNALLTDLTQQIVRDAATGGKIIQVTVRGAPSEESAQHVAQKIAHSTAVRQACARGQPDWGTLLVPIGCCGEEVRVELLDLFVGHLLLMSKGVPVKFDRQMALQLFSSPEIDFTVDLQLGPGAATIWTCTWNGEML